MAKSNFTMVETPTTSKESKITIRPYFDARSENMGLEDYGLSLFDGVKHQEQLASSTLDHGCLNMQTLFRCNELLKVAWSEEEAKEQTSKFRPWMMPNFRHAQVQKIQAHCILSIFRCTI